MEHQSPASCLEEWNTLEDEFKQLEVRSDSRRDSDDCRTTGQM